MTSFHRIQIIDIGFGGMGVGRLEDGCIVFVPFVAVGETVRIEVVKKTKKYAQARLIEVEMPSSQRVTPPCVYFGQCGGCAYQHLSMDEQLRMKEKQVVQLLRRIAHLKNTDIPFLPITASPHAYAYRNRITVHTNSSENNSGNIGFYKHELPYNRSASSTFENHRNKFARGDQSREIIDVEKCSIATPLVNEALTRLRKDFGRRNRSYSYSESAERHYTIRGDRNRPRFFEQTNDAVASLLKKYVKELVEQFIQDHRELEKNISATDLFFIDSYCGSGFFGKAFTDLFDQIIGIEWDEHAIEAAQKNATPKETYIAGDVSKILPSVLKSTELQSTLLMLDPPSEGLADEVIQSIYQSSPEQIIYVSCNPSTLARDLGKLLMPPQSVEPSEKQPSSVKQTSIYELKSVAPFDMFPQTAEIEVVVVLRLKH